MIVRAKTLALAAVFTLGLALSSAHAGNNSWAWSKPLNKKAGHAFYTGNKNINNSYSFRSRAWRQNYGSASRTQQYRSHNYYAPRVVTPSYTHRIVTPQPIIVHRPPTTIHSTIVTPTIRTMPRAIGTVHSLPPTPAVKSNVIAAPKAGTLQSWTSP